MVVDLTAKLLDYIQNKISSKKFQLKIDLKFLPFANMDVFWNNLHHFLFRILILLNNLLK